MDAAIQSQPTRTAECTRACLPALLSALLGMLLYSVTLAGTYVYDDLRLLKQDSRLTTPARWGEYWTRSYNGGPDHLYRPLVSMSFAIEWALHGDRPWIFHLINLLLHAAVCACVAELARRLLGAGAGLIAGLLFAADPIHVEAVANIAGRAEIMCALGMLGALVLFLKTLTTARAFAIAGCFVLALLSKEQGMLLPLLLLMLGMLRRPTSPRHATLILILLCCWILAGYLVFRETILPFWWDRSLLDWTVNPMVAGPANPHGGSVGLDRWLMPLVLLGRYLALLVAPLKLSPDYGGTIIGWHVRGDDPYFYLGLFGLVSWLAILVIAIVRKMPAIIFSCLAFAIVYGMVGNVVALIGTIFAERLIYIPSAFFLILVAAAMAHIPFKWRVPLLSIAVALGSIRAVTYAARWNDELRFYEQSLREQPNSIQLQQLLIDAYRSRGQFTEAEAAARRGREMMPEYVGIWIQSGRVALEAHKFDLAEQYFLKAASIHHTANIDAWLAELHRQRATTQSAQ